MSALPNVRGRLPPLHTPSLVHTGAQLSRCTTATPPLYLFRPNPAFPLHPTGSQLHESSPDPRCCSFVHVSTEAVCVKAGRGGPAEMVFIDESEPCSPPAWAPYSLSKWKAEQVGACGMCVYRGVGIGRACSA